MLNGHILRRINNGKSFHVSISEVNSSEHSYNSNTQIYLQRMRREKNKYMNTHLLSFISFSYFHVELTTISSFFFFFSFSSLVCLYDLAPKRECIVEYVLLFFYTSIMSVRLFFVIVVCHCRLVQYVCESTKWNWLLEEWLLKWILLHALSI